jgi:hypothetical protein
MEKDATYRRLLDDFAQHTGLTSIQDKDGFYRMADIIVDEINFSLMPGGEEYAGALLLFCDFGPIPPEHEAITMRRLLETNTMMMGVGRPSFGINFSTGHVVLSGAVPVADMTGELLLQMLRHYAEKAKMWRETHFLLDEERQGLSLSDPNRHRTMRLLNRGQRASWLLSPQ